MPWTATGRPARSLNRRAYLIESAARNRYVPRLLPKNRAVSTVICIPLYEGITPLASLVLVATAPRVFGQADITALWKPLREFGRMIDRIRRQGFDGEPQAAPFREQIALHQRTISAERDRLLQETAAHRAERERLAAALEEQVASTATLRAEIERVAAERDSLRVDVGQRRDDDGQLEALRETLTQAEHERERVTALLEESRAELEHRSRESRLHLQEARADLEHRHIFLADGPLGEVDVEEPRFEREQAARKAQETAQRQLPAGAPPAGAPAPQPAFRPGGLKAGHYLFDVAEKTGSAGSVTLVAQTIIPVLLKAAGPSTVTIRGGTHVPWSPPVHYLTQVFLPALAQMGVHVSLDLTRWGWYPRGGGEVGLAISPTPTLTPVNWQEPPHPSAFRALSAAANLPEHVVKRQAARLKERLGPELEVEEIAVRSQDPGSLVFLWGHGAGFSALGARGKPAEKVADEAAEAYLRFRARQAALDRHLADQLANKELERIGPLDALLVGRAYVVYERGEKHDAIL